MYKKKSDCKIFHSSTKLIASGSDINEAFNSMHQSIMETNKKLFQGRLDCLRCNYNASVKIFESA